MIDQAGDGSGGSLQLDLHLNGTVFDVTEDPIAFFDDAAGDTAIT